MNVEIARALEKKAADLQLAIHVQVTEQQELLAQASNEHAIAADALNVAKLAEEVKKAGLDMQQAKVDKLKAQLAEMEKAIGLANDAGDGFEAATWAEKAGELADAEVARSKALAKLAAAQAIVEPPSPIAGPV